MQTLAKPPDPGNSVHLSQIFESGISSDPFDEIAHLVHILAPAISKKQLFTIHRDIDGIFSGYNPGFRENRNKYHNLRHTYAVVLATVRLFHGLSVEGVTFSSAAVLKGLLGAYFHDTGLLLKLSDSAENGAAFTQCHEKRSMDALSHYLETSDLDTEIFTDCSAIIQGTTIDFDFLSIPFTSAEIKLVAQIVATADILAQMADRYYIEQLPHLYQEHKDGGVIDHESVFELMKETASFYDNVIKTRLETVLADTARAMKLHFQERWNLDRDFYRENVTANIDYLQMVVGKCANHPEQIFVYLQRRPPRTKRG
ncbi:MAG: hypothetical protein V2I35_01080 [Desulfocapsaceae bacterium]|jgi:hypothetical protein|nr:hypothetical protein [Desulfocapsaceae bacterium]